MLYWILNLMKSYQTIKASWQHSFQHFPKHRQSKNQKLPTAQENHLHTILGIIFPFRSPHTLTHVSGPWICKRVSENPSLWSVGCGGQNDTFMEEVVWVCVWAWIWLTNTHLCWSWCRAPAMGLWTWCEMTAKSSNRKRATWFNKFCKLRYHWVESLTKFFGWKWKISAVSELVENLAQNYC